MRRRDMLCGGLAAVSGVCRGAAREAAPGQGVLSEIGCGRATGYAEAVKVVTWEGRTHVTWLDSAGGAFVARVRSVDRETGEWGEAVELGGAEDNHGGAALAVDGSGYLHAVWGPHHGPFRYRRSTRPNDATAWQAEERFGERLTYPTLVVAADGGLVVTGRRSFSDGPWEMELWRRAAGGGGWERGGTLVRARWKGYSHFQESLAWGGDHRELHLCFRAHEKSTGGAYGRVQTVVYLRSPDGGVNWETAAGEAVELPADVGMLETAGAAIASGGVDAGRDLRAGGMAVSADGAPLLVWSEMDAARCETYLSRPDGKGGWASTALRGLLPEGMREWSVTVPGGVTVVPGGGVIVVTQVMRTAGPVENWWGHASSEVGVFRFDAALGFEGFEIVSKPDGSVPHWLPNVERATGFNRVPARPGVIWTAGGKGESNAAMVSNRVVFANL